MSETVEITRRCSDAVNDLREMFLHLHAHHTEIAPELGGMPARHSDEAWEHRRARYQRWLADPRAFVLVAEREGHAVGAAVVAVGGGYDGWESGAAVGEIKDLVVAPGERGQGVGSALLERVEGELREAGFEAYRLNVLAANKDAIRLYERRGLEAVTVTLMGRLSGGANDPSAETLSD